MTIRRRNRRGSAMTEFALCSTVLIMMAVGGTDLARVFSLGTSLTQAAKAGAQFGAFSSQNAANTSGITAAALAAAPGVTMEVTSGRTCLCGETAVTCGSGTCGSEPVMYLEVQTRATY
ncbi:MAG: pilus assembly protein [Bryobacterales bacterium]|nr:pilus assembly protein [Bryobacterales bacterium]